MSQEHRFCAEIYARLFSLIDRSKRVVVNPDGNAKLPDHSDHGTPPDMCFTLCGLNQELRVEAKIIKNKRDVSLQPSQRNWCLDTAATCVPHLWIEADRELGQCWLFTHDVIAARIRNKVSQSTPLNLWPNIEPPSGCSLDGLALKIVAWATDSFSNSQDAS
ncbi:MAG: hypothetical protein ACKO38_07115 [Planctomycetota bacterium]